MTASSLVILKLFHQSLFHWTEYLWNTTMFYFNADNAAARKPQDRRSASCSSISGLRWFNKFFSGAMARNVAPSCRPGPGLVNTIFAESWGQYGNIFFVTTVLEHALAHTWNSMCHRESNPLVKTTVWHKSAAAQASSKLISTLQIFSTQNYFSVIVYSLSVQSGFEII